MTDQDLAKRHRRLLFSVRRSVRYHRHRERFLDWGSNVFRVVTAIAGTATIVSLLSALGPSWPKAAAGLTAVLAALDIVFAPGRGARLHNELARDFIGLEQDLLRAGIEPTLEALVRLETQRLDIEAKEPPHYRVLNMMCHNEVVKATGKAKEQYVDISWFQRRLANLVDVCPSRLEKRARVGVH